MSAQPAFAARRLEVLEVLEGGVGVALADARRARGLSIDQVAAATRIRPGQIAALERDDLAALPGPVYARGHLRTYATYLGLDPEPLMARLEPPVPAAGTRPSLSLARLAPRLPAGLVLSGPMLTAAALVAGIALFAGYAWYELRSARLDAPAAATAAAGEGPPIASPRPLASAAAPPAPAPAQPAAAVPAPQVAVAIRAAETTWVQVTIDGKPAYGPAGKMLAAGSEDVFVGSRVRIGAGKPSVLVSVAGGDYVPLGALSREYSAQT